ncbi:MAG: hypothetical protein V1811_03450 [Candidatus Micrarchaeota archaeon]
MARPKNSALIGRRYGLVPEVGHTIVYGNGPEETAARLLKATGWAYIPTLDALKKYYGRSKVYSVPEAMNPDSGKLLSDTMFQIFVPVEGKLSAVTPDFVVRNPEGRLSFLEIKTSKPKDPRKYDVAAALINSTKLLRDDSAKSVRNRTREEIVAALEKSLSGEQPESHADRLLARNYRVVFGRDSGNVEEFVDRVFGLHEQFGPASFLLFSHKPYSLYSRTEQIPQRDYAIGRLRKWTRLLSASYLRHVKGKASKFPFDEREVRSFAEWYMAGKASDGSRLLRDRAAKQRFASALKILEQRKS